MKQGFMFKYILAVSLVVMLIMSVVFYHNHRLELEIKEDFLVLIQEIKALDSRLTQSVLMVRFGFRDSEADIDNYLKQINEKYIQLIDKQAQLKILENKEIDIELKRFAYHLDNKKQIVARFKTDNKTFYETLKKFQTLATKVLQNEDISTKLKNKVYQIQKVVLNGFLDPRAQSLSAGNIANEFSNLLHQEKTQHQQKLKELAVYLHSIIHDEAELRVIVNKIIEIHNLELIDSNLEKKIRSYFLKEEEKEHERQAFLMIIAVISVLYVVFLLLRLTKKSQVLGEVLSNMEKQQFALNEHAIVSAADVKGNIIYVNDKFCQISEYTREELIGKNHRIVKSEQHPPEVFKQMWRTIAHGQVWHGELKNRKKNGGYYWVNGTIVPFLDQKRKPYQYISVRTDITRQKELEKQLYDEQHFMEKVTGTMAQGVYALDMQGICTFWNTEAEHILGWKAEELIGKNLHEIINYQDEQGNRVLQQDCLTYKSIQNKQTYSSEDGAFTHKDGRILPIAITAVPLVEDDNVMGSVAVFNDITKRKADEKLLNEAIINAQQANKTKSEFLANMSHEIRTPMNGIIGMTHLALETDLNPEQREYLEIVKDSSNALLNIINDILDFSKIEAGKLVLEKIDFNLDSLLKKSLLMLAQRAEEKGIELVSNIGSATDIPNNLVGDPGRLRQVIINLVGNAIKFTMQGRVKIKVSLKEKDDKKCCLLFAVSDTGIGIPKDKQDAIFDSFSQADTSVSRKFGGTGLGLSISKQFINLMNGKIWLKSLENEGTTFYFTAWFDYKNDNEPENLEKTTNTLPMSKANMVETNNENKVELEILLAEDNLINQKLAKKLLEKHGHKVHIASNGLEAIEEYKKGTFDLILMDFQMPEMNGLEATENIRLLEQESGTHIPIIAMTANAMKEDKEKAINAGMDAYVPKPININELLSEIANFFPEKKEEDSSDTETLDESDLCNWDEALARLGGETEVLEMMATLFLEEQQGYLENIENALNDKNSEILERELHTLKGVVSTLGGECLEKKSKILETLAAENKFSEISELMPELKTELEKLVKYLNKRLSIS